jgi:drug/metabolite transporter (DMT)-like permease
MSQKLKAELALAFATIIWGGTFVVVKTGLEHISALAFVAARFLLGSLVLLLFFRPSLGTITRRDLRAGGLLGIFLFAGFACMTTGLRSTAASKAAFINSFEAVLPAVLLAVIWKKPEPPRVWAGAVAATLGLYLISVPAGGLTGLNRGDVLVFCGAVLFSFHTIYIGRLTPHHDVRTLSLLQVGATAVLAAAFLPLAAIAGIERMRVDPAPELWVALLVSGVGSLSIGLTIQVWAQRHTSASHAGLFFSLIPVFATLASYFFLGERLGGREWVGAGCIFAGVLVASLAGVTPETETPALDRAP